MGARTRAAAGLFLATATLNACSDASSRVTTTVVDSAGVRIVSSSPGSIEAAEAWSLSDEPVANFGGGVSPEVPFSEVAAVVPLDGGRVAAGVNGPPQVLVIGADGVLEATIGREGEGPGEFSAMTSGIASIVRLGADSLFVWDQNHRRMSVFTEDGRHVRDVDLSGLALVSPIATGSAFSVAAYTYLLPSTPGSLVLFAVGYFGPGEGVRRVEAISYRITLDGDQLARLGPFPGEETFMTEELGMAPYPFGANTYGAASGDALLVGTAEAPAFHVYSSTGALEQIVRWPDHDRTVSGPLLSDWTDFVEDWLASMPAGERRAIREILDAMPPAEQFPAYDGIIAAESGEVWVGAYAGQLTMPPTPLNVRVPARRWLVFSPEGELTASVQTPEGFQPYAVHEGRVWGVFRDEYDIESVLAYEVVKG